MNQILTIGTRKQQQLLHSFLEDREQATMLTAGGNDLYRNLSENAIDLVIYCLSTEGPFTLEHLRNINQLYPGIPSVVILKHDENLIAEAMQVGASACITYPPDRKLLRQRIDGLLGMEEKTEEGTQDNTQVSTSGDRIALDIGARLKIELGTKDVALESTMVGMIRDRYLIMETPTPREIFKQARLENQKLTIKYIHLGRLCTFTTSIVEMTDNPAPLLFLKYPSVIHYHELRRAKRTSIFIPCTMHPSIEEDYYGILVDLSSLGCLCRIKARGNDGLPHLDIDARVELRCLLPGVNEDQQLQGVVKNLRKSANDLFVGLEFVELPNYISDVINNYLYAVDQHLGSP